MLYTIFLYCYFFILLIDCCFVIIGTLDTTCVVTKTGKMSYGYQVSESTDYLDRSLIKYHMLKFLCAIVYQVFDESSFVL